ncbi:MAG: NAD(P)H-dependent oxidoreductase [Candidatus Omnitrophica bacterium]|nr:NAD(P)H-dependent oxidoreductase [Candidatus Omnitrophota bacterium]MBU1871518.1 NAD(P)H-dependent oxidoreductase [Candidatus Omnitrophota bacterium]
MPKILVTYYSRTGNTKKMAEEIVKGVSKEKVPVELKKIEEINAGDLLKYDSIIIGSPTYYGSMAAGIKQLLDDSVKFHGKLEGKVGGAFASSANIAGGNETTILDIINALLIHGMIIQGDSKGDHYGPVAIGAADSRAIKECQRFGERTGRLVKKLF